MAQSLNLPVTDEMRYEEIKILFYSIIGLVCFLALVFAFKDTVSWILLVIIKVIIEPVFNFAYRAFLPISPFLKLVPITVLYSIPTLLIQYYIMRSDLGDGKKKKQLTRGQAIISTGTAIIIATTAHSLYMPLEDWNLGNYGKTVSFLTLVDYELSFIGLLMVLCTFFIFYAITFFIEFLIVKKISTTTDPEKVKFLCLKANIICFGLVSIIEVLRYFSIGYEDSYYKPILYLFFGLPFIAIIFLVLKEFATTDVKK